MNRSILLLLLITTIVTNIGVLSSPDAALVQVKLAVILSGVVSDLGFNYMVNNARVRVEKQLSLRGTKMFEEILTFDQTSSLVDSLVRDQGFNLIICSSFEHKAACFKKAAQYPDTKFVIKDLPCYSLANGNCSAQLPNVATVQFNLAVGHYLIGYISALVSSSHKTGMVVPGPPSLSYVTTNSFKVGVAVAVEEHKLSPTQVYNIETGSWLNVDVEIGATKELLGLGVDVIGMSADDLSVHQTAIAGNATTFGTSGFSVFEILGESILTSVIKDWTRTFANATLMVQYGNWSNYIFDGDLTGDNDITIDPFSYLIDNNTMTLINNHIDYIKNVVNRSRQNYYCHPLYGQSGYQTDNYGCVSLVDINSSPILLNGIENLGRYTIPPVLVKRGSVAIGLSVTSGILALIGLVIFGGIFTFRQTKIMKSASPSFSMAIVFGGLVVFASVIAFSLDPTDHLCRLRVWFMSLGYTILIGNMVIKNFRIWLIFDNPHLKKMKITNLKLLPYSLGLVVLNSLILAIYTGIGEIHSERAFGIDNIGKYEYLERCTNNTAGNVVLYILLIYHAIMLLVGCFVSWKIRIVSIAEFNESKPIANTLYAISFCLFIIVPLMVSQQTIQGQIIIISVSALFTTASALIILFVPKFWRLYTKGLDADPFSSASSNSNAFSMKNFGGGNGGVVSADPSTTVIASPNDDYEDNIHSSISVTVTN